MNPLDYIQKTDSGCWTWVGHRGAFGYGLMKWPGRSQMAHRAVYEALVGPIADGLVIDHLCRNKICVNPAHLEAVTIAENSRRNKGFATPKPLPVITAIRQRTGPGAGYISRDEMLFVFGNDLSTMDAAQRSGKALDLAKRHGLTRYPDPNDSRKVLYSRAQCERVWKATNAIAA